MCAIIMELRCLFYNNKNFDVCYLKRGSGVWYHNNNFSVCYHNSCSGVCRQNSQGLVLATIKGDLVQSPTQSVSTLALISVLQILPNN